MILEWYLNDFARTTNQIDYAIQEVKPTATGTQITLARKGLMPMPIDFFVKLEDGSLKMYYIPLRLAFGQKANPYPQIDREVLKDWSWAKPTYTFEIPHKIQAAAIDPTRRLADVNAGDNDWSAQ